MHIALAGPVDSAMLVDILGGYARDVPPGLGGAPLTSLAATLLSNNHQVSIITLDSSIDVPVKRNVGGVKLVFCPFRGPPRYPARLRSIDLFRLEIEYLTDAIRSTGADIVHAHWTYEFAEAAIRSGLPHLVTMHDLGWDYLAHYRDLYRLMRLLMKYRVMHRVKRLSVVAPFMRQKAWQYGYFGQVDVVPNSVITSSTRHKKSIAPAVTVKVVSVGDLTKRKNIEASLNMFRFLRSQRQRIELHLFGPGLDAKYAELMPGVIGHGNVPHSELIHFLSSEATVLFHPSRLETFGMIVAEAMGEGVPALVGRQSGGVTFVVGEETTQIVENLDDPEEVSAAVLQLISNPDIYAMISNRGIARVMEEFSPHRVAGLFEVIYEEILSV